MDYLDNWNSYLKELKEITEHLDKSSQIITNVSSLIHKWNDPKRKEQLSGLEDIANKVIDYYKDSNPQKAQEVKEEKENFLNLVFSCSRLRDAIFDVINDYFDMFVTINELTEEVDTLAPSVAKITEYAKEIEVNGI